MNFEHTSRRPRSFLCAATAALLALAALKAASQTLSFFGNDPQNYIWTTLAGTSGVHGMAPGTGPAARFGRLTCAAVDASGNLYVTDVSNYVIWKITSVGVASVFCNLNNLVNLSPQGGQEISEATAVTVAPSGTVYAYINNGIAQVAQDGTVTFLAKFTGNSPQYSDGPPNLATVGGGTSLSVDSSGNFYFPDGPSSTIREYSAANIVSTIAGLAQQFGNLDGTGTAARFNNPTGIALDTQGNLYVTDSDAVRKIAPGGVVTTLAGEGGVVGYADGTGSAARFYNTNSIAVDSGGNLYVTVADNTIRLVTPAGAVTTIGGASQLTGSSNGGGSNALFNDPNGIAVDAAGDIYVVDEDNAVIRKCYAASPAAPSISTQPSTQSVAIGASVTLTVAATGVPAPTYQWLFDGNYIAGATNPTLTISNVQASNLGTYTVVVSNANGSAASSVATISSPGVTPAPAAPAANLVNISTRAEVMSGADVEIVGFVVAGPAGSTEQLLIRGDGNSLGTLGVPGSLYQPVLTLYDVSGKQLATNTDYGSSQSETQIVAAAKSSGAFALTPISSDPGVAALSWDSALLATLAPGTYTAVVTAADGNPGVALAELYAVGANTAHLTNISTRAYVGTGAQVAIAGISVAGNQATTVLVRAVGPALSQFSVSGVLAQPSLNVMDNAGNTVGSNTGWTNNANAAQIALAAKATGAFALPNPGADSALLLTLQPGNYTAVVSGAGGASGVALVEVYQLP